MQAKLTSIIGQFEKKMAKAQTKKDTKKEKNEIKKGKEKEKQRKEKRERAILRLQESPTDGAWAEQDEYSDSDSQENEK